ncbi:MULTISPECIES: DEAD/DEAH box helicase [unclassified Leucobacter]|uniref:DEAD/DEAH box helicase n=1 Tax=unclassified Leucobacter TaxID=2621730 RepID=UPI00165DFEDD|nr:MULTISPECIES: DEAD/DEAH box helicase [unclassified Leucobacter]MBC9928440.1 DEAD/DEAH box helicase [Leucobacter sp. cx-169]
MGPIEHAPGTSAAEQLSPAYPERAAWGTAGRLRAWQAEAIGQYFETEPRDFLASATPGAGKTTFALRLAAELRGRGSVEQVIVVAPTEHLKKQWAEAAFRAGIRLNPSYSNADGLAYGRHYHGIVVTYAQVSMKPVLHKLLTEQSSTLVILDEVHHGGDALSWGDAIREAYGGARRRLSLTGTPFRSDDAEIPFVRYAPQPDGTRVSLTDYGYGYGRALADGIVRPVVFMVYAGKMRWQTSTGEEMEARLGEGNTKDITSQAWRTALDPAGDWIAKVLRAANRRLSEVREHIPDAGGLVIATDHASARSYASQLSEITGESVALILSDDSTASDQIESFSAGTSRWMVAVRMVSEGVDVPRLAVGVYATSSSTPLFFAQAIGRFVRSRRRGEVATVFIPNVPALMQLAQELEKERDHVLEMPGSAEDMWDAEAALLAEANREDRASEEMEGEGFVYQALGSDAHFDRAVFDGTEFGGYAEVESEEELEFLGFPGLLEPTEVRALLIQRQSRQAKRSAQSQGILEHAPEKAEAPGALFRTLGEQRKLLSSLVGMYAKVSGEPHPMIHTELRRSCGGPPVAQASVTQLQDRIDVLRRRLRS